VETPSRLLSISASDAWMCRCGSAKTSPLHVKFSNGYLERQNNLSTVACDSTIACRIVLQVCPLDLSRINCRVTGVPTYFGPLLARVVDVKSCSTSPHSEWGSPDQPAFFGPPFSRGDVTHPRLFTTNKSLD
jgi:hypothetical protein